MLYNYIRKWVNGMRIRFEVSNREKGIFNIIFGIFLAIVNIVVYGIILAGMAEDGGRFIYIPLSLVLGYSCYFSVRGVILYYYNRGINYRKDL